MGMDEAREREVDDDGQEGGDQEILRHTKQAGRPVLLLALLLRSLSPPVRLCFFIALCVQRESFARERETGSLEERRRERDLWHVPTRFVCCSCLSPDISALPDALHFHAGGIPECVF